MPGIIQIDNINHSQALIGNNDEHLKSIEEAFDVIIHARGQEIAVKGQVLEHVEKAELVLKNLLKVIELGHSITLKDVEAAIKMAKNDTIQYLLDLYDEEITKDAFGKTIRAKTMGQRLYINAMKRNDLVFGIGPAGTGKTFLAVVYAAKQLRKGTVKRIVLTRPAVEAGESLGFLPGDLKEKVDPYLRPLYDGLNTVLGREQTARFIERGTIEIAPLAYMRGRTLDDAFVILDEAQNTTHAQMKMFLTRLGFGSKMVVTGDQTQIDLPKGVKSGLKEAIKNLRGVKGINIMELDQSDVVRHPLVSKIIERYEGDN
ncbi:MULTISPECIES: PhoH family protein [Staphylococcus]|jgi:phosphate starvation-inducible PhoH-like protein|uniref:PhoH-like protein n=3 Tax=Staphylococcus TaxID=1279 RepID=A0A1L8Y625_STAHO|nr:MULTISPECIES: PhoH family protein [Staphylococcus]EUZ70486.1 PhoH family phosphate starvation-induced protein [Staphylococcus sp. M0480]OFM59074.1 phosphate starvation-inducible protein PhoH [Staphylococcus sp. HMSC059G05]OFM61885.1 phosphate starvation-inducible protein PhoH [Staphylococcus sp. HMSC062C01]OFM62275.1 phosphate starvation-inducible protein PhoH [Staphylococcus sp. HMSC068D07]OFM77302.1 phosphate starvation-inducible protein PhoH [Staphylococcus sp. HMSC074B09]OFM91144.1 pho